LGRTVKLTRRSCSAANDDDQDEEEKTGQNTNQPHFFLLIKLKKIEFDSEEVFQMNSFLDLSLTTG